MATLLSETFESYATGNLEGQGGWYKLFGNDTPQIQVVAGSLVSGVNSVRAIDVGGTPGERDVAYDFASNMALGTKWSWTQKAFVPAGSYIANRRQACTLVLTSGNVLASMGAYETSGGTIGIRVTDNDVYLSGGNFDTGIASGNIITMKVLVGADGYYRIYVNDVVQTSSSNFFAVVSFGLTFLIQYDYYWGEIPPANKSTAYDDLLIQSIVPSPFPGFFYP